MILHHQNRNDPREIKRRKKCCKNAVTLLSDGMCRHSWMEVCEYLAMYTCKSCPSRSVCETVSLEPSVSIFVKPENAADTIIKHRSVLEAAASCDRCSGVSEEEEKTKKDRKRADKEPGRAFETQRGQRLLEKCVQYTFYEWNDSCSIAC